MRGLCLNHLTNGPRRRGKLRILRFRLQACGSPAKAPFAPLPLLFGSNPLRWALSRFLYGGSFSLAFWVALTAPSKPNNVTFSIHKACLHSIRRSSPRPISTGQLNTLLHLHFQPINQIVLLGPYSLTDERSYLRGSFTLRCLQRLSRPYIATQLCRWHDNWCTRGIKFLREREVVHYQRFGDTNRQSCNLL